MAVRPTPLTDGTGQVWIELGEDWPGFNRALADSVSSLSPRGMRPGLSTYWIDATLDGLTASRTTGEYRIAWGDETELVVKGQTVQARSLYELFETERMPRQAFEEILQAYRTAVVTAVESGATLQMDSYVPQRNPWVGRGCRPSARKPHGRRPPRPPGRD